mmetsp:Transcript_32181/g.102372  ORF Transcript_32181/g.102372 Transcript_32181/m.102372 type:complete len:207 (-) Transcript_32181:83-703(-)
MSSLISSTLSASSSALSSRRMMSSSCLTCSLCCVMRPSTAAMLSALRRLLRPELSLSSSASSSSSCSLQKSTFSWHQSRCSRRACSSGSSCSSRARPALLKVFVFASRSSTLKASILVSILRRASSSGSLSRTSLPLTQLFTWSRSRCSFLMSFFSSASYFSRRFCASAWYTFSYVSSKFSHPSSIFRSVRSTSAASFLFADMVLR